MANDRLETVRGFPKTMWGREIPGWDALCNELSAYTAPEPALVVKNPDRKWEIVSAYQKSVRRGEKGIAQWLISGSVGQPKDWWQYMWRRVCTTAAEDVGPANKLLMKFVIVCSTAWTPSSPQDEQYHVLQFLTEKMCDSPRRSRIYCSISIIENRLDEPGHMGQSLLKPWDDHLVKTVREGDWKKSEDPLHKWLIKSDWRGEGMLKYECIEDLHIILDDKGVENLPMPEFLEVGGLPEYAYDMHTRVGKGALIRLTGFDKVKKFFEVTPVGDKLRAMGFAMFYVEGGRIKNELISPHLWMLEVRYMAHSFGITVQRFSELMNLMTELIASGDVAKVRAKVYAQQPYV